MHTINQAVTVVASAIEVLYRRRMNSRIGIIGVIGGRKPIIVFVLIRGIVIGGAQNIWLRCRCASEERHQQYERDFWVQIGRIPYV